MDDDRQPRRPRERDDDSLDDLGAWEPGTRSSRPLWQTARLAGLLIVVLLVLVVFAIVLPGLGPVPPPEPLASPSPSAVAASAGPSPSPTFVRPTPTPAPTLLTHLVETGESLTSIARLYDTTPRSIAFWNRATYPTLNPESEEYEPNNIQVGWLLQVIPGQVYDEFAGSPSPSPGLPGASPGPDQSAAAPTPPPTTSGPSTVVSNGPRGTNQIALTFDMGGRLDPAVDMMTWLLSNGVPATIFPTGSQGTVDDLGRAAMEIVRDHPELFEMGNHSWDHPSFTDLAPDQMRQQLRQSEDALLAFVGRSTKPFFRPPFGAWNDTVRQTVGAEGWAYTVLWDIDTIDWRPTSDGGPTALDIEARVLSNAQGGSIVLMHLGGYNTLEALPGILSGLREKGLEPVTLSELLGG